MQHHEALHLSPIGAMSDRDHPRPRTDNGTPNHGDERVHRERGGGHRGGGDVSQDTGHPAARARGAGPGSDGAHRSPRATSTATGMAIAVPPKKSVTLETPGDSVFHTHIIPHVRRAHLTFRNAAYQIGPDSFVGGAVVYWAAVTALAVAAVMSFSACI